MWSGLRKFVSFLRRDFNSSKCKTWARMSSARVKLLRNKREAVVRQMRRDVAMLLQSRQESTARIRVEHVIREQNMMAANEIIEVFCERIVTRLCIISKQRECPNDLKEAISSLIFAAPRCPDVPELLAIRDIFRIKYGSDFVSAATDLRPDSGVNRLLVEKLSALNPPGELKLKVIKEIAKEYQVQWDATHTEAELLKPPEDRLEGPRTFVSASTLPLTPTARLSNGKTDTSFQDVASAAKAAADSANNAVAATQAASQLAQPGSLDAKDQNLKYDRSNGDNRSQSFDYSENGVLDDAAFNTRRATYNVRRLHSDIMFDDSDCDEENTSDAYTKTNSGVSVSPSVHPKLPDYDDIAARFQHLKFYLMSPAEHANLWRVDAKMLCPNYNYFSRVKHVSSLSNYAPSRSPSNRPSISASSTDQRDLVECLDTDSLLDPFFLHVITVDDRYHSQHTVTYQPLEEPWLLQPQADSSPHISGSFTETESVNPQASAWCFPDRDRQHPVEDPWLLYPPIEPLDIHTQSVSDADVQSLMPLQEQEHQASEKLLSGRESNPIPQGSSLSTEILINCSICTMQRIAVLEDGSLVELLLDPVKSNVQCDSVYLGVVTKLVPHMGGAFVNIGTSRPSLMDINSKREPFLFPPFGTSKETHHVNDSPSCIVEQAILKQHDSGPSDDDPEVDFEDADYEEHELEDDGGFGNHLNGNGNGNHPKVDSDLRLSHVQGHKSTTDIIQGAEEMWALVRKGTKIVVQVVKEGLGSKGPTLTAYPKLRSRFWVLITHSNSIGVSKKISGVERTRLRVIAKSLQPTGFGVTVRTVAAGHSVDELRKDLEGLLSTWRNIMEHATSAALAADEGVEGAVPVILHQAMGQTLSVVQDYFNEKVKRMVVDSPRTYHEVTNYLQGVAPDLCDRVELHRQKVPLFDEFNIEEEINNILNKRVALPNGGSLVIEQTEALVSIDVNGGHGMFGQGASQEKAILDVNLAAAKQLSLGPEVGIRACVRKVQLRRVGDLICSFCSTYTSCRKSYCTIAQIARELRLRDIGGIIVVDFIDMMDDSNKRLIFEEFNRAVERDRSTVKVSELSKHGLMEITRKRVRPSVTFMISEPCTCCHGTGRVEALETSFSKIEHGICSLLATMDQKADLEKPKFWPRLLLRVDTHMCDYLTSGKKTRLATLSSSLKVWILLKVARSFTRGAFELKLLADDKGSNSHHQMGVAMLPSEPETSKSTNRTKLFTVKKWKAGRKGQA